MSQQRGPDDIDLTDSAEVLAAMAAAVGRLRQLAAVAFNADRGKRAAMEASSARSTSSRRTG